MHVWHTMSARAARPASPASAGSMAQFHKCERGVLVSTDVAARGLDFPAVTHIIQYDPPGEISEYVQRVGRTARLGRRGVSLLFLSQTELQYKDLLTAAGVPITQQKLYPALATLPAPPVLSQRATSESDANRRKFQVAMDAAHLVQVGTASAFPDMLRHVQNMQYSVK